MNRRQRGQEGEDVAWEYLQRAGFRLVERNFRTRAGEIDLIVERRGTLVFVEVRSRSSSRFGTPLESVDVQKQRQVARVAQEFLARRRLGDRVMRFDVVAVEWQDGPPRVEHVENAFEAPD